MTRQVGFIPICRMWQKLAYSRRMRAMFFLAAKRSPTIDATLSYLQCRNHFTTEMRTCIRDIRSMRQENK